MCTWGSWWAGQKINTRDGTDIKAHQVTSWWWARENVGTWSASGCAIKDESEWSLNTSLMLRFGALFPELAGRSLRRMFPLLWAWWFHWLLQSTKCKWGHVSWWQLWSLERKPRACRGVEKAPCLFTFQNRWEPGGLRKPQTSAQLFGMDPRLHNCVGDRRCRQGTVRKYFIGSTDNVAVATTPGCTIEVTCNQMYVLRDQ